MANLEGSAPRAPGQPALAYLAGEVDGGVVDSDGLKPEASPDGDVVEMSVSSDVVSLQRELEEKERATQRAKRAALERKNELNTVKAEAASRKEILSAERNTEPGTGATPEDAATADRLVSDAFTELAKVRTESFKARIELEKERKAHRSEMVRAHAQYHAAQVELQHLIKTRRRRIQPVPTPPKPPPPEARPDPIAEKSRFSKGKLAGAVVALGLVLSAPVTWPEIERWGLAARQERARNAQQERARGTDADPPPVPPPIKSPPRAPPTADASLLPMTPADRAQFEGAVSRLSRSLGRHPGRTPEAVLRAVHERYKESDPNICAFEWKDGQPSLLYGGGHLSLGQTIQRCADAVDRSP